MKNHAGTRSPHIGHWQLQEARNRLSEVVNSARCEGPQTITLRGEPAAVVISVEEYKRMLSKQKSSLSAFFAQSPLRDVELDLRHVSERSK